MNTDNKYYKTILITLDFLTILLYNITILYFYARTQIYKHK